MRNIWKRFSWDNESHHKYITVVRRGMLMSLWIHVFAFYWVQSINVSLQEICLRNRDSQKREMSLNLWPTGLRLELIRTSWRKVVGCSFLTVRNSLKNTLAVCYFRDDNSVSVTEADKMNIFPVSHKYTQNHTIKGIYNGNKNRK